MHTAYLRNDAPSQLFFCLCNQQTMASNNNNNNNKLPVQLVANLELRSSQLASVTLVNFLLTSTREGDDPPLNYLCWNPDRSQKMPSSLFQISFGMLSTGLSRRRGTTTSEICCSCTTPSHPRILARSQCT